MAAKKNKQKGKVPSVSFQLSVSKAAHPRVAEAYQPGLAAMGGYSAKIVCKDPRKLRGSLDIDSALANDPAFAQQNRWDYGFGYQQSSGSPEIAVWVEVHSAHTSEVSVVIRKKNWLRDYLLNSCADLWALTSGQGRPLEQFYWVASNGVKISKNSPQARALATAGVVWPQNILRLD